MENNFTKIFFIKISINCVVLVIGAISVLKFTNLSIQPWSIIPLPIFGFIISTFSFYSAISKSSIRNFSTLLSSLFGIKFFAYLILTIVFFLIEKEKLTRLSFITALFVVYLANTFILLTSVLKYYKGQDLNYR